MELQVLKSYGQALVLISSEHEAGRKLAFIPIPLDVYLPVKQRLEQDGFTVHPDEGTQDYEEQNWHGTMMATVKHPEWN